MRRLRRSICYYQGLRISVAYIFSRTDNDPARNKPYVLSTFQHTGQIVQSSVGITAAHTFNKSRNDIVMIITFFIIALQSITCHAAQYIHRNFLTAVRQHKFSLFQQIKSHPRITTGKIRQSFQSLGSYSNTL